MTRVELSSWPLPYLYEFDTPIRQLSGTGRGVASLAGFFAVSSETEAWLWEVAMVKPRLILWSLALLLTVNTWSSTWAREHRSADSGQREQLGNVNFPVSCNQPAQTEFNRAMALFHSFWFEPAKQSFTQVLQYDPQCAMAHWGIAMMSLGNPFAWPPNSNALKTGVAHIVEAQRIGAKSERERGYIAAAAAFLNNWETTDHRSRALAFEKSMEDLTVRYPKDDEAQILYALLLNVTAQPTDKTFKNQLKAAGILEPLFKKYPNHPGVAHYLVHTYDYAELAPRGLAAARVYANIALSVPHALHMPSHIFSRVGLWPEMVAGNRASYLAAKNELTEQTLGIGTYDALHAMDYMVFGHCSRLRTKPLNNCWMRWPRSSR